MRTLPRFVPSQFIAGLLSLVAVSLSLPASASSVTYEIETESESGETAMSFEFRNDMARMNFSEDNYFIVSEDGKKSYTPMGEGQIHACETQHA